MKTYDLSPRDLYDIREQFFDGQYFDVVGEGVQFRDVLAQEPLLPQAIPTSVHDNLRDGFDHLKSMGRTDQLRVHFLLGGHGSAADFEAAIDQHEPLLNQHPYIGIEAAWTPRDPAISHNDPNILPEDTRAIMVDVESAPGRHDFQAAQFQWLWSRNKTLLACQNPVADTSELYVEMSKLWDIYSQATADISLDPGVRNATRIIAERTYQSHRQWMLMGQLGRWLYRLDSAGKLDENVSVPVMLGKWHELSVYRLGQLGVQSEKHMLPSDFDSPAWQQYGKRVMEVMYQAASPISFLRTETPY